MDRNKQLQNASVLMASVSREREDRFYQGILKKIPYRIAIDGGLRVFHALDLMPDLLVGDLDSILPKDLAWAQEKAVPLQKFSWDKDATDTQLALDIALTKKKNPIYILGALGKRLDHTLGNLGLILYGHERGADVRLLHPRRTVSLLAPDLPRILLQKRHEILSLIPITPNLAGLTMTGFRWNLTNATIARGSTHTISNYLEEKEGRISLQEGLAFLIQERKAS